MDNAHTLSKGLMIDAPSQYPFTNYSDCIHTTVDSSCLAVVVVAVDVWQGAGEEAVS